VTASASPWASSRPRRIRWQRVVDTYNVGDELEAPHEGRQFGAFVEILDGVEGLVHISELAAHHVENRGSRAAGGRRAREDPRDRLRAPSPVAVDQARGGQVLPSEVRAREAGLPLPGRVGGFGRCGDLDERAELGLSEDSSPVRARATPTARPLRARPPATPTARPLPVWPRATRRREEACRRRG